MAIISGVTDTDSNCEQLAVLNKGNTLTDIIFSELIAVTATKTDSDFHDFESGNLNGKIL